MTDLDAPLSEVRVRRKKKARQRRAFRFPLTMRGGRSPRVSKPMSSYIELLTALSMEMSHRKPILALYAR